MKALQIETQPVRTALCVGQWLPASETFIYDQVRHQSRTRARIIARDRTEHAHRFPYDDVISLGHFAQMAYYHWGYAPRVERALLEHQTQVVHAHFGPNGTMVLGAAKRLRLPLLVSLHGHDVGGLLPQNRRKRRYARYQRLAPALFEYGQAFLCASSELREMLIERGAPEKKTLVHYLGVDGDFFCPPRGEARTTRQASRILIVGRLVEKKGISDGIRAFAAIANRFPECHLVIVGDGPLRAELRGLVTALELEERVIFRGALSPKEVLLEMQEASILLTPSHTTASGDRESGVVVVKEAGATGLPTVATLHGGLPEIIDDGVTGFLVPERNVHALSDRLERLLSSPSLRANMGKRARALILRKYDARRQNEILEDMLVGAAHDAKSRACSL